MAMDSDHLYTLEILLDCLCMMNARNLPAEKKYNLLAEQANVIANNLMKAINMDLTLGTDD